MNEIQHHKACASSVLAPHPYQLDVSPYDSVFLLPSGVMVEVANLVSDLGLVPAYEVVDDVFELDSPGSSFDWRADFNRFRLEKFYKRNHSRKHVYQSDINTLF